jgi:tetratricopeptide (TPR) repeat protein
VAVGDVYAILAPRDLTPIGRVEITEVGEQDAWGTQLDARGKLAAYDTSTEQWARARALYEPLLVIDEGLKDAAATASTLQLLAQLDAQDGHVAEAQARFQRALAIEERIGDVAGQIRTLYGMGVLEATSANAEGARAHWGGARDRRARGRCGSREPDAAPAREPGSCCRATGRGSGALRAGGGSRNGGRQPRERADDAPRSGAA